MYIPKYFKLYELLPKNFYNTNKYRGVNLWFLFDHRILWTIDQLRKKYGKMNINTWYWGGNSQYRGWRPFNCGVGAKFSQHKFGRGIDLIPNNITPDEIRKDIKANPWNEEFKYITCIEEDISWLHIDTRNWRKKEEGIFIIKP